jgi:hypothetical protein
MSGGRGGGEVQLTQLSIKFKRHDCMFRFYTKATVRGNVLIQKHRRIFNYEMPYSLQETRMIWTL